MKTKDHEQLNNFIKNHLENIRKNLNGPSKELRVLQQIVSQGGPSFPEVVSMSSAGEGVLILHGVVAARKKTKSPKSVDEIYKNPSQLVVDSVDKRIIQLEKEGVTPAPLEEVTSENMEGFLNNTSNYLYDCVFSSLGALSNAGRRITEARITPGKATIFEKFCNVVIDQSFKGILGGQSIASIGSRMVYGGAIIYGRSGGVNATTGMRPKGTYIPVKEAIKALAVGLLESGSASGAIYSASKRATYNNLWKISGGKSLLNQMNFSEAGNYYLLSKKLTSEVMKYTSQAVGEISDDLIEEYTGISGQTAKLAAGAAGLAILMTINTYLCQDKVQAHNPEVVSSVQ